MAGPFNLEALKSKAGPLPVWQWALIGGGAIAILAYLRRPKATDTTTAAPLMINPALSLFGGGGGGSGGSGGTGSPPPTPPPDTPPPSGDKPVWWTKFVTQERDNPNFNHMIDVQFGPQGGSSAFWTFFLAADPAPFDKIPASARYSAIIAAFVRWATARHSSGGAAPTSSFTPLHTSSVHAAHIAA